MKDQKYRSDQRGHPCGLEKSGKLPATGPRPGALPSSAALLAELRAGRQRLRAIFMEAEVELQGTQRFRWSYVWDCKGHDGMTLASSCFF